MVKNFFLAKDTTDSQLQKMLTLPTRWCHFPYSKTCPRVAKSKMAADNFLLNKKMWTPRSPDLNHAKFYLWDYLKTVVNNPGPKTLEDFIAKNIQRKINRNPKSVLKKFFENFEKRGHLVVITKLKQEIII